MIDSVQDDNLNQDSAEAALLARELSFLFGAEIVEQVRLLDITDLNMTDEMTCAIAEGIKQLKQLRNDPEAQRQWVGKQAPGLQLLLCLWIMEMELLDKIQMRSYL